ncbi:MAG: DEAD/DEAH box helicase, partial [Victivallales bacterium]|nr:DEAD/DEAH box helicase [Victivallales bacterium]
FVNPGLLDTHSHFQERFAVPIESLKDKEALERLSNIVKPFVLRRLKKDVLQELPQKTEISLQVSLSEEESHFYEALRLELLEEIHRINDDSGRLPIRVIAAITKLRLAVCNSKLIDPPPSVPIPSSKMEAFLELLDELLQAHHKILVFSQFVKHLKLVENEIQKRGIAYQYLDGDMNSRERTAAVNAFQRGKGDVFLISLRAGGMGLNLTAADYVIHLDPWWNPAVEDQASDRAYRIGQDKPVTIYRLIAKNTIESKIIELHQSKRELAENLLQGTDVFNQITKDDLIRLLKN